MSDLTKNQEVASKYLAPFKDTVTGHFINGQVVRPKKSDTFENLCPADNSTLGDICQATQTEVDEACTCAAEAFAKHRKMMGSSAENAENVSDSDGEQGSGDATGGASAGAGSGAGGGAGSGGRVTTHAPQAPTDAPTATAAEAAALSFEQQMALVLERSKTET